MVEMTQDYVSGWQAHRREVLVTAQTMLQALPAGERHASLMELVRVILRMKPPRAGEVA